jgi:hypothetical protein
MLRMTSRTMVLIDGFIGNDGKDSNWSIEIHKHPSQEHRALVGLYWGDKDTPTHETSVSLVDLKAMVGSL